MLTIPLVLLFALQAPSPMKVEGRSLKTVPGPMVPREREATLDPGHGGATLQLRRSARRSGTVPAVALPCGEVLVDDQMDNPPAGWKAYRAEVGPRGSVHVRLKAVMEAWFRVSCVNKWGEVEAGMLQNKIPTGNPEASFHNPKADTVTVWFIVDLLDPDTRNEPYTLLVTPKPAP